MEVFYIGKGKKRRMYQHQLDANKHPKNTKPLWDRILNILDGGNKVHYEKFVINADETTALNKERELVETYGRVDLGTGPLLNQTGGGSGSTNLSPEYVELKRKFSSKPVSQYTLSGDLVSTYPSSKFAAECVPTANRSYITQCCKGKRVSSGGFQWVYEHESPPSVYKKSTTDG